MLVVFYKLAAMLICKCRSCDRWAKYVAEPEGLQICLLCHTPLGVVSLKATEMDFNYLWATKKCIIEKMHKMWAPFQLIIQEKKKKTFI